ncbi:MAG: AAA family ATPase, partial [Spirochaetia bacterium]|nr:AAA family ATPase [Spirochaetia bacterium]
MLLELKIENIGIVEEICLRAGAGLNVITGETGSGKSLVLHSLDAVLGARIVSGLVRKGSSRGSIQATFDCSSNLEIQSWLTENDLSSGDSFLLIKREISAEGKSRASINGIHVTLASLRSCASLLIEIHGQHEHQRLFDPDSHMEYLDIFAGTQELRNRVSELYHKYTCMKNRLKAVTLESGEKEQRLDFLHYALEEIESFDPHEDEFEQLSQERAMIQNSGKYFYDLNLVYGILRGEESSILDQISSIAGRLEEHASVYKELEENLSEIREADYRLESVADFIREEKEKMHYSPERLEDIEERIAGYKRLHKKYGGSTGSVLSARDSYLREISSIEMSDEEADLLCSEIEIVYSEMKEVAEELSRKRRSVAHILENKISEELSNLGMPGSSLHISVNRELDRNADLRQSEGEKRKYVINEKGLDRVEFLLRANLGESIQPL